MQNILLIGAGVIARTHAKSAVAHLDGAQLHVTDLDAGAVQSFVADFPGAVAHASVEAMLAQPAMADDIVVVCTPPGTHAELAAAALESQRHVLCEKPLTTTIEDAHVLVAKARAAGRHIACCSSRFLGYSHVERVKELLASGELGRPYHITCIHKSARSRCGIEYQPQSKWFLSKRLAGGGILLDWGVYDIAVIYHLLSPVRTHIDSAFIARPQTITDPVDTVFDVETHGGASLRLMDANDWTTHLTFERATCTYGEEISRLEFECERGAVRFDYRPWGDNEKAVLTITRDDASGPKQSTEVIDTAGELFCHDRPLVFMANALRGRPNHSIHDNNALFHIASILGIFSVAETSNPQTVEREFNQ